jgi:hypothetical protein
MARANSENESVQELVTRFRDLALDQEVSLLDSDVDKFNQLYDELELIDQELRRRGIEARRALLTLLDDENCRVRYTAAVRSLAVDRKRSLATIEAIVQSGKMPEAGEAANTLDFLRDGIFEPT